MRYAATPSSPEIRDLMSAGVLDCIVTPRSGNAVPPEALWIADNGCFSGGFPGEAAWLTWLERQPLELCWFAVAPDVVGNAAATLERAAPWLPRIRALGIAAAYVAQNGATDDLTPWDALDVLFIGGDTAWKLGGEARALVASARRRGKRVHMGRVNSQRRWMYARHIGCQSADGTLLAHGPDRNLPDVLAWIRALDQPDLFSGHA
jgi:hypothetical protein